MNFIKMHGLGNDFIIFDARKSPITLNKNMAISLSDRNKGIGCDQIAIINDSDYSYAKLEFWNSDGSRSDTCGNATRCIGKILFRETDADNLILETAERQIECKKEGDLISVNMGLPLFEWHEIPLSKEMNTLSLDLEGEPTATSMGNPHCTFFVEDLSKIDVGKVGHEIETDQLFLEGTNVQFVEVIKRNKVKAKIWERGAGITMASGSSSCAIAVAGVRRDLLEREVEIELDGGLLEVKWAEDGVWLKGPTSEVYEGTISKSFFKE